MTPFNSSAATSSSGAGGEGGGGSRDSAVAKTAGFLVFSGIAISIIKTLASKPLQSRAQPRSPPAPAVKIMASTAAGEEGPAPGHRAVEIVKGDTLWGLSRKYGVSIDAIRDANGIEGDTIYAGKKLVIP